MGEWAGSSFFERGRIQPMGMGVVRVTGRVKCGAEWVWRDLTSKALGESRSLSSETFVSA